jgi:hypothetical protein
MKSNMLATALGKILPKKARLVELKMDDRRFIWANYAHGRGLAIVKNT